MNLSEALQNPDPSARLQAAMDAGSRPDPAFVPILVDRCAAEPDFNVREMLTWALIRNDVDVALPLLFEALQSPVAQARSQALHTLSKFRDPRGWTGITPELLFDADDQVARTAWRAAALLAPDDARADLAVRLATLLGRGERDVRMSLSRALADIGPAAQPVLAAAAAEGPAEARVHAIATQRMIDDPEEGFESAEYEARRQLPIE